MGEVTSINQPCIHANDLHCVCSLFTIADDTMSWFENTNLDSFKPCNIHMIWRDRAGKNHNFLLPLAILYSSQEGDDQVMALTTEYSLWDCVLDGNIPYKDPKWFFGTILPAALGEGYEAPTFATFNALSGFKQQMEQFGGVEPGTFISTTHLIDLTSPLIMDLLKQHMLLEDYTYFEACIDTEVHDHVTGKPGKGGAEGWGVVSIICWGALTWTCIGTCPCLHACMYAYPSLLLASFCRRHLFPHLLQPMVACQAPPCQAWSRQLQTGGAIHGWVTLCLYYSQTYPYMMSIPQGLSTTDSFSLM